MPPDSAFCGRCGTRQRAPSRLAPGERLPRDTAHWYPDPFGRFAYRFWNGEIWTNQVFSDQPAIDVLSPDFPTPPPPDGAWVATVGSLALSITGLVVAFGLSIVCTLPYLFFGHPGGVIVALVLSEAGLWAGLFGTCVLTSRRYGTGRVRADFRIRFRPSDIGIGVVGAIVARCVSIAVLIPFIHLLQSSGNPDRSLESAAHHGAFGWVVLVAVSCVGAPVFEELFFRGLLQGQLVERFGATLAIPVTSLVFGAAHIANDPGVAGLLLALSVGAGGLVLGTVRHITGRLGSSMATHALFNGTAMIVLALSATR